MELFFYSSSLITIIFTVLTVFSRNVMHSLLYLIISFLSTSCIFFSLGAFFAAALEVIIYAGAIMVLFIFFIMILNLHKSDINLKEKLYKKVFYYTTFLFLTSILIVLISYILSFLCKKQIFYMILSTKLVAMRLFGDYILIIELSSIVLLSSLIFILHIGKIKN